jgi:hypothetical protein
MPLIVDFTKARTFKIAPKGDYPVTLTKYEIKPAADSPFPNLIATFTYDPDAPNEMAGQTIGKYYTSNPDGLDFFRRDMTALGADPDDFRGPKAAKLDMEDIIRQRIGDQAVVRVDVRDFEGEPRNDFKKLLPKRN